MQTASGPILWAIEACWFCMYEGWWVSLSRVSREWAVILGKKTMWIYGSMVLCYACIGATTWPHSAPQGPVASTCSELWILEGASNKLGLQKAKGTQETNFIELMDWDRVTCIYCSVAECRKAHRVCASCGSDLWLLVCVWSIAPLVRVRWILYVRLFCIQWDL